MKNFTSQIAGLATLALAALPAAAIPASAFAQTTSVKVADLNLATAEGMAIFEKRARNAASSYCADVRGLVTHRGQYLRTKSAVAACGGQPQRLNHVPLR